MVGQRRQGLTALWCLAPSALIVGGFHLWPLFYAAWVSLHDWGLAPGPWVGLANYRELARDPLFRQSLGVTLWYVLGTVPPTLALAYLVAELLHQPLRGRAFYRVLFFTPYVVSPVAAAAVWKWVFDSATPPLNHWLARCGLDVPNQVWLLQPRGVFQLAWEVLGGRWPDALSGAHWLAGPSLALCCVMAVTVWTSLGFAAVVLLAGLSQVPGDVLEAARLDGAVGWRLRRHVVWPLLSPTLFFLLIVFTIRAFQAFNQIYVLTPRGLLGRTSTVTYYIYETAFMAGGKGPGFGSAVAFVLLGIILALTALQFRLLGRRVHYGGRA
jgi:multiple sugar transport system permease protein